MGSEAPLFQAGKGGELQGIKDLGPRPSHLFHRRQLCGHQFRAVVPQPPPIPKLRPEVERRVERANLGPPRIPQFPPAAPAALGRRGPHGEGGDWESDVQIPKRFLATLGVQETWEVAVGRVRERNGMRRSIGRASGRESALGFPDAPASDPHGEGSSGGGDSLGKAGEQGKPAWCRRTLRSVRDQHAPAPPLQMKTIEVGLEAGWGWKRLRLGDLSYPPLFTVRASPLASVSSHVIWG